MSDFDRPRVRITSAEHVQLIEEATATAPLNIGFGPSGVWLYGPDWALNRLLDLRTLEAAQRSAH